MDTNRKTVVDEIPGWLRIFNDGTVDRTWTGPPELGFLMSPVPPHEDFIDGVAVLDQTINPNTGLAVRIYFPEPPPPPQQSKDEEVYPTTKLPIILHFHGGGFCISQPDWYMYYHFYTRLARSAQAVCVSVYLRRAPEHPLPAAEDDAYAALLWLRDIARGEGDNDLSSGHQWLTMHGDFGRVFLVGDSTGGNLVHQVAAKAGGEEEEDVVKKVVVAGGVAIHPGFLREVPSKSFMELPDNPLLTREMVNKFLSFALPAGSTKDHPITCPMGPQAPPLVSLRMPPMLVVVAEMDLLRDSELEYCEEMRKAGKEVKVLMNQGMGHSFYFNKMGLDMDPEAAAQADKIIEEITKFIHAT
ncbi:hypothetical protein Tsubulata_013075 [Turnera subulata]|uniref:Alpha/beta hydrolase fold-3 domain-containing protein n=1 Tax=Turnera subulata TaxID=218843 RepID=A0A9Q0F384_9ROSI|nr:hypothetical protein Tsubulata_013075 [Turnera subulata]